MLHCLLQVVAASVLFWLWTLVVFNRVTGTAAVTYRSYFVYWLLVSIGLVLDSMRTHQAKTDLLNLDFIRNCGLSFRQTVTVLTVLLIYLVASKDHAISRTFLFTFIPILFFLCLYSNGIYPRLLANWVFSGRYLQNTVMLGDAASVKEMDPWLKRKRIYGINVVGLITDNPTPADIYFEIPILGSSSDLEKCLRESGATQLIRAGWPANLECLNGLADTCHRLGVRLLVAADFDRIVGRKVMLMEEDGFHVLGFFREPLECPFNRGLKRVIDLMVAVPAVILLLPPACLLVWLLHRWQSPGPLFFSQKRTGMFDREFVIYKFRTMFVDNPDEARQAAPNDHRVFPAARWMRRLSIDEIPQFINVIKGEMSVVGPRPHLRAHDDLFKQAASEYCVRGFIKPGMTGLAQVRNFRGETKTDQDMVDRVQSDLDYLENWSFLLDSMIILRTVWKVLFPPKAAN